MHLQQVGALDGVWAEGCKVRQQGSQAQGHHLAVEGLGAGLPPHELARLLLELDEVLRAHSLSHFVNDSLHTRSVSADLMESYESSVSSFDGTVSIQLEQPPRQCVAHGVLMTRLHGLQQNKATPPGKKRHYMDTAT